MVPWSSVASAAPRFVSVAAGDAFACALDADGGVWCWGDNREGELGGTTTERFASTPARVPGLDGVVQVAAARHWAAAVRSDGTVWTWGRDGWGMRTGDPSRLVRHGPPTLVQGLSGVARVALGEVHGCALRRDGTVWCWGSDADGRLGDADRFRATAPPPPPGSGGPAPGVAPPGVSVPTPARADPRTDPAFAPAPVPGIAGATAVAAFGTRTAALVGGELWEWGRGATRVAREWGALGARPVDPAEVAPAKVAGLPPVASVALRQDRALVVADDGAVWGTGTAPRWWTAPPQAGTPAPFRYPELSDAVEAAAFEGGAVRLADGAVAAWGGPHWRGDGGAGPGPSRLALDAVSLSAGREFVCAVDRSGAVWCWGSGWAGQLGPDGLHPIGESAVGFVDRPVKVAGP